MYNDKNITVRGNQVFIKNKGYEVQIEKSDSFKLFELLEELRCQFNTKDWDKYKDGDRYYTDNGSSYKVKSINKENKTLSLIS